MPQDDGMTAYGRLANEFWERIASGELAPGTRLPTVAQMAKERDISPATVRAAMELLASQGFIHSRQGRGTFVAKDIDKSVGGLPEIYFDSWVVGPTEMVEVLDRTEGMAIPDFLADGAPTHDSYIHLKRLHHGNGHPVCVVDFYCATVAYRSLPKNIDSQFKIGLLLMTKASPNAVHGRQITTVSRVSRADGALLGVPIGSPVVKIDRRFLDARGFVVGGGIHRYPGVVFRQVIDQPTSEILAGLEYWLPSGPP